MNFCISNLNVWFPFCDDAKTNNELTYHNSADIVWPKLEFIPAMQRRRLSNFAKMALYVANKTVSHSKDNLPIIFSSRHGDLHKTSRLLEDLALNKPLSPTAFGLSVHNAVPSLYSILTENKNAINAIAAGKDSFFMALIEAYARLQSKNVNKVLLVHADQHLPEPYTKFEDEKQIPHAVSMILTLDPVQIESEVLGLKLPEHNSRTISLTVDALALKNTKTDALPIALTFAQWFTSSSSLLNITTNQYEYCVSKAC